jgi:hypothetical protein
MNSAVIYQPGTMWRLIMATALIFYPILSVFALCFAAGNIFVFCFALYEGKSGGPDLLVAPFYAAGGIYLLIESIRTTADVWCLLRTR